MNAPKWPRCSTSPKRRYDFCFLDLDEVFAKQVLRKTRCCSFLRLIVSFLLKSHAACKTHMPEVSACLCAEVFDTLRILEKKTTLDLCNVTELGSANQWLACEYLQIPLPRITKRIQAEFESDQKQGRLSASRPSGNLCSSKEGRGVVRRQCQQQRRRQGIHKAAALSAVRPQK